MRFTALFPFACATTAFVLSIFCILAGSSPGYMEEYHIVTLNTSTLGHNLLSNLLNATQTSSSTGSSPTSLGSFLNGIIQGVGSTILNDIGSIENDLVDKLASKLGIRQWYSLHMMDLCEGTFSPNASTPGAGYNVTSCTNKTALFHFDPAGIIDSELNLGALHINLTIIEWPSALTDGISELNTSLDVTFVMYCIGIAACGLVVIFSAVTFFLPSKYNVTATNYHYLSRMVCLLAGLLAFIAFLTLGIASAIVSVFMDKFVNLVTKYGNDIGLYTYKGDKFLSITWAATCLMLLAVVMWIAEWCFRRHMKNREWEEKHPNRVGGT